MSVCVCVCVSCVGAINFAFNLQLSKRLKLISATLIKLCKIEQFFLPQQNGKTEETNWKKGEKKNWVQRKLQKQKMLYEMLTCRI